MKKLGNYLLWGIVILCVTVGFSALGSVGSSKADFSGIRPIQKDISYKQLAANKPTVVYIWATWCGICRTNLPIVKKVYETLNGLLGIEFISIEHGPSKTAKITSFIKKHTIPYPVFVTSDKNMQDWGISAFPTTLYVHSDGTIYFRDIGIMNPIGVFTRMVLLKLIA